MVKTKLRQKLVRLAYSGTKRLEIIMLFFLSAFALSVFWVNNYYIFTFTFSVVFLLSFVFWGIRDVKTHTYIIYFLLVFCFHVGCGCFCFLFVFALFMVLLFFRDWFEVFFSAFFLFSTFIFVIQSSCIMVGWRNEGRVVWQGEKGYCLILVHIPRSGCDFHADSYNKLWGLMIMRCVKHWNRFYSRLQLLQFASLFSLVKTPSLRFFCSFCFWYPGLIFHVVCTQILAWWIIFP